MKRSLVLGLVILTLGSTAAVALESTPRIDKRQDRQDWRINHGIENGSLTEREARRLHRETRQIQRLEQMALGDGHLHGAEIDMLEDALDALSDWIYEAKHNHRQRFGYSFNKRRSHDRGKPHYDPRWQSDRPHLGPLEKLVKRK